MDEDLHTLSREALIAEAGRLRAAIRSHRDASGHDLCWHHPQMWSLLPEQGSADMVVPAWPQFLRGCIRYRQSLDEQAPQAPRAEMELEARGADVWSIRLREIDHLVLRVVDLDRMLAFYCDVLGCHVERRQEALGLVQLRAGRSLVDLVPVGGQLGRAGGAAPGKEGRNLDHFCFRLDPFDEAALRRHLAAHQVDAGPIAMRFGAEGEGPSMYLSDPEGNVVELKGPPAVSAGPPPLG
jgi:catechol 2,3-dioxygenase-like lactoylglutathione lyase family enzyme